MKKWKFIVFVVCLLCLFGCNNEQSVIETSTVYEEQQKLPQMSVGPKSFETMEEFKSYVGIAVADSTSEFQIADVLEKAPLTEVVLEGYNLQHIDYREGVYIAAYYVDNDYKYNDNYSSAENARFSKAIYGVFFYEDAEEALRLGYLERDYKPVMIGEKQYYCNTEYTSNGDIMGYGIVFIVQDSLMYVHLPYAEGFEVLENCAFALDKIGE